MCQPASFIITKGPKALWSKTFDSHSDIRKEYGLPENGLRPVNVQVEITPPDRDFGAPFGNWKFRVDQDMLPDWWDAADAETETRRELENWARVQLVRAGETRDVRDSDHVIAVLSGGTVNRVSGGTVDRVSGGTVNEVSGGTVNEVSGGTVNEVSGGTVDRVSGGTVDRVLGGIVNEVPGGTVNRVYGGIVNEVYGGIVNEVYGGTVNRVSGGTVNRVYGGTVNRVSGGTVNRVYGGIVNEVYGGTVNQVYGGTVGYYLPFVTELKGETAVVIDRTGATARCFVGRDVSREVSSSDADDNL